MPLILEVRWDRMKEISQTKNFRKFLEVKKKMNEA